MLLARLTSLVSSPSGEEVDCGFPDTAEAECRDLDGYASCEEDEEKGKDDKQDSEASGGHGDEGDKGFEDDEQEMGERCPWKAILAPPGGNMEAAGPVVEDPEATCSVAHAADFSPAKGD